MSTTTDTRPVPFADLPADEQARIVDEMLRPFVREGTPKYTPEQIGRLGSEVYERVVEPKLTPADDGRFVIVDVESGEYEVGDDEFAISRRLLVRVPGAYLWATRVGYVGTVTHRFGWKRA